VHGAPATRFRSGEKPITLALVRRFASPLLASLMMTARVLMGQTTAPSPAPEGAALQATAPPLDSQATTASASVGASFFPEAPAEAPPPLPSKKGLVLETRLGGLAFLGKFGDLAPTAPWIQTQLGWEFFKWLMAYGYGELAFTGTSNETGELTTSYFPLYGFGGGLRGTVHMTDRLALFVQANAGAMSVIVPRGTLAFLGFANAESPGFAVGTRLGVEWYQVDHHMALSFGVGLRDAFNFKIQSESDLPLMLDAGAALRYTF
jgi:hypothetical protein